jgi:hypothetical protein
MIKVERLGDDGVVDKWHVTGALENGGAIDAVLETEIDGRDAWWDEDTSPCETAGVDPGFDETGWEEVLEAINEESDKHPEWFDR